MDKILKKYSKQYREALKGNNFSDIDTRVEAYEQRLNSMYASGIFAEHNIYPTMNVSLVYGVIAMCLELKESGLSDCEIISFINSAFDKRRKTFGFLYKIINNLPNSYNIAKKWNISDHEKREKDGSLIYDYFNVSDTKIEYRITKCMYIEMFEYYGIRGLCKIFCMTDEYAYAHITKNIKFIRHSDLCCGECCHDEVIDRRIVFME